MHALRRLVLTQFRCFDRFTLEVAPGLTVIEGANARGKTALIEALWLLASGRSFRTARLDQLIRHGQAETTLYAEVGGHRLGWGRRGGETRLRLDGETVRTQAELSARFPAQLLTPESHRLLEEGPRGRRQYLDWGGFHQQPGFLGHWRAWRQALRQRNAALRQGLAPEMVRLWDGALVEAGEALDALRQDYVTRLEAPLRALLAELLPELAEAVTLRYQRGWRQGLTLAEALEAGWEGDVRQQTTRSGPHRADLACLVDGHPAETVLSRGQQKLFVCALLLAQAQLYAEARGHSVIMLIDDLPAELDAERRARLLALLEQLGIQRVVTTTDRALIPGAAAASIITL